MAFKDIILAVTMAVKKAKAYTDSKTSGLGGGVTYKGSVNYYSNLPANPEEGDAYTVKYAGSSGAVVDGTEYVWGLNTDTNTMEWIEWSKDCYTKAETDTLLGAKQNTIDATHKLSADNVDDSSSTNKFTNATEKQTWDGKQNAINSNNKLGGDVVDLTGYTAEANPTTWATPAATDTLDDAIKKLDNNTRLNKNNISSLLLSDTGKTGDLNDVTANEFAVYTEQSTHLPTQSFYYVRTTTDSSADSRLQEAFEMVTGEAYVRTYAGDMWSAWKLSNLNDTQLAAVNSGIDSTKVAQIETNQNNILLLQQEIGDINTVLEEVL